MAEVFNWFPLNKSRARWCLRWGTLYLFMCSSATLISLHVCDQNSHSTVHVDKEPTICQWSWGDDWWMWIIKKVRFVLCVLGVIPDHQKWMCINNNLLLLILSTGIKVINYKLKWKSSNSPFIILVFRVMVKLDLPLAFRICLFYCAWIPGKGENQ